MTCCFHSHRFRETVEDSDCDCSPGLFEDLQEQHCQICHTVSSCIITHFPKILTQLYVLALFAINKLWSRMQVQQGVPFMFIHLLRNITLHCKIIRTSRFVFSRRRNFTNYSSFYGIVKSSKLCFRYTQNLKLMKSRISEQKFGWYAALTDIKYR